MQCSNSSCQVKIFNLLIGSSFRLSDAKLRFALLASKFLTLFFREGISRLIPGPLLSVLTGARLEEMVCGAPHVSVSALKQISRYRDMDEHDQVIKWLWEVLTEFDDPERVLFLKFVSGRSRLPGKKSIMEFLLSLEF